MTKDRNYYIELRVYLKDFTNGDLAHELADELQDHVCNYVSDDDAPIAFTEDVTYEVVRVITKREEV